MTTKSLLLLFITLVVITLAGKIMGFGGSVRQKRLQKLQSEGLLPVDPMNPTPDEIARLAKSGEKILAIKLYRDAHSVGLKEAKDAVEKLAAS